MLPQSNHSPAENPHKNHSYRSSAYLCKGALESPCTTISASLSMSVSLTSRLMARKHSSATTAHEGERDYGGRSGVWHPSTKAVPLPCLLHKRPDDIETGLGRVGLKNKEEGERKREMEGGWHGEQQGEQQKGRKRREGGSCCSTGSQQIGWARGAEVREQNAHANTHRNTGDKREAGRRRAQGSRLWSRVKIHTAGELWKSSIVGFLAQLSLGYEY